MIKKFAEAVLTISQFRVTASLNPVFLIVTWSLLLPRAPGFFFFFVGQGEVSADE